MEAASGEITGIVLSGGQSRRIGQDKGLILLGGKPMVSYSINVLAKVCGNILIGANQETYNNFGYPVIGDEISGAGPAAGILSCLKASNTNHNFILSCDMPLISTNLIKWILENRSDADVVLPIHNGLPEPLCGYFNKAIVADLESMINSNIFKLQDIHKQLKTKYLEIAAWEGYHEYLFENVNSKADLERINHLMDNMARI